MTTFDDLSNTFADADIGQHPAEWHGFLCGAAAGLTRPDANFHSVIAAELAADHTSTEALYALIEGLVNSTLQDLNSEQFKLQPLLPDDDWPLADRVEALAAWCQGYVSGLGQSGMAGQALSEDMNATVRDIAAIGQADTELEGLESEEQDYTELVEYVRVAVLLIHAELGSVETVAPSVANGHQKTVH